VSFEVKCAHDSMVAIGDLYPHPQNPNEHPEEQLSYFRAILAYQGWRRPITVSKRSGFVVKGHGALMTARSVGETHVPVDFQDYPDEAAELADMVADNQLAKLSQMNTGKLLEITTGLAALPNFDLQLTGFSQVQLLEITNGAGDGPGEGGKSGPPDGYTKKIEAPIYEPKEEDPPPVRELVDEEKYLMLLERIDESMDLPNDVRGFLRAAAARHRVFDYERIAEFYAHASADVQQLMEESALVIIDFNKAIENGFVTLSQDLAAAFRESGDDAAAAGE
jgi:hypothetical protein